MGKVTEKTYACAEKAGYVPEKNEIDISHVLSLLWINLKKTVP